MVGLTREQKGHSNSENSMMVTGALGLPLKGAPAVSMATGAVGAAACADGLGWAAALNSSS
jgi:hypothetical protein